eukprot:gene7272-9690_t
MPDQRAGVKRNSNGCPLELSPAHLHLKTTGADPALHLSPRKARVRRNFKTAGAAGGAGSAVASFLPLILIFGIMYMLLIRPQQKKMKDLKAMVEAVRRGDQVLTAGGIIGKVVKVGDDN